MSLNNRSYTLTILVALSAFNQLDRQLTSVLLEPIRHEFMLSDVQLGLLSGPAFMVLFAGMSVPAAIWAVHASRRNLIAVAAAFWGGMTFLSGLAHSYWALVVGRIGVGLGEAGAMPASHALISDLYEPHERGGAMAAWSSGVNIGVFLAFLLGGMIGHLFGWRAAFVAAGLATMAVALLMMTVVEPARNVDADLSRWREAPSWTLVKETGSRIVFDAPMRQIVLGSTMIAVVGYADIAWTPSFFVRAHGLSLATIGTFLAFAIGIGGGLGAMLGGHLTDRLQRRHAAWGFGAIAIAYLLTRPFVLICYLTGDTTLAMVALIPPALVATLFVGPSLAVLHNRIPPTLRPAASALFLMTINLIGLGAGPLLVGVMSQWLFAEAGSHSLGYAMSAMQFIALLASVHFFLAGRCLAQSKASLA